MIGKNFIFDGNTIPWTKAQGISAGWYADFDWHPPAVRNSQIARQDFHGVRANPTFAEGRLITVSGEIFSVTKASRGTARNTIDDIFHIEDFPALASEFKKLEFTDDDGTEWFIWAKVYSMPDYSHRDRGDPIINFTFELFAQDPLIRSKNIQEANGIDGLWGGTTLPVTLPVQLSGAINQFEVINAGNFAAPAKITITGEITNPKVFNLTTGRYFEITTSMSPGDELIIDTDLGTVELNGVNALANRAAGSNWLFVNSGSNFFVLTGDSFDYDDQGKATIKVEWYNTKI